MGHAAENVAQAFGAQGVHVTQIAELAPAIKAAFASRQPTRINVEIELLTARHN